MTVQVCLVSLETFGTNSVELNLKIVISDKNVAFPQPDDTAKSLRSSNYRYKRKFWEINYKTFSTSNQNWFETDILPKNDFIIESSKSPSQAKKFILPCPYPQNSKNHWFSIDSLTKNDFSFEKTGLFDRLRNR